MPIHFFELQILELAHRGVPEHHHMELFTAVFSVNAKLECEQEPVGIREKHICEQGPVDKEETHLGKNAQGSSWRCGAQWTASYHLCTLLQ